LARPEISLLVLAVSFLTDSATGPGGCSVKGLSISIMDRIYTVGDGLLGALGDGMVGNGVHGSGGVW